MHLCKAIQVTCRRRGGVQGADRANDSPNCVQSMEVSQGHIYMRQVHAFCLVKDRFDSGTVSCLQCAGCHIHRASACPSKNCHDTPRSCLLPCAKTSEVVADSVSEAPEAPEALPSSEGCSRNLVLRETQKTGAKLCLFKHRKLMEQAAFSGR